MSYFWIYWMKRYDDRRTRLSSKCLSNCLFLCTKTHKTTWNVFFILTNWQQMPSKINSYRMFSLYLFRSFCFCCYVKVNLWRTETKNVYNVNRVWLLLFFDAAIKSQSCFVYSIIYCICIPLFSLAAFIWSHL